MYNKRLIFTLVFLASLLLELAFYGLLKTGNWFYAVAMMASTLAILVGTFSLLPGFSNYPNSVDRYYYFYYVHSDSLPDDNFFVNTKNRWV